LERSFVFFTLKPPESAEMDSAPSEASRFSMKAAPRSWVSRAGPNWAVA
jgi:hypothetical protein